MQCGWLQDKFGLSWQTVPTVLLDLIKTRRGMEAMIKMVKA
jgi:predicted 3-demethylubiquinone-9 3-methyltransferase (glyoxalase superfamily)